MVPGIYKDMQKKNKICFCQVYFTGVVLCVGQLFFDQFSFFFSNPEVPPRQRILRTLVQCRCWSNQIEWWWAIFGSTWLSKVRFARLFAFMRSFHSLKCIFTGQRKQAITFDFHSSWSKISLNTPVSIFWPQAHKLKTFCNGLLWVIMQIITRTKGLSIIFCGNN